MKKFISAALVLILCVCLACPVFAAETEFLSSPGIDLGCEHGSGTKLVGASSASCTKTGYTGDLVCVDCGEVLEAGTVIPKTEHQYKDGFCEICGVDENNPKTGDNSFIGLWMVAMLAAAVGLVAVIVVYRKKFANQ